MEFVVFGEIGEKGMPTRYPTIISFYAGDQYYHGAAERLRKSCEGFGLEHDIVELGSENSPDWAIICAKKIPFYLKMHKKHGGPILWLDADTQLLKLPEIFNGCGFDMAGFARGGNDIRDVLNGSFSRFWYPGILFFGGSRNTSMFLEHLDRIYSRCKFYSTDDYLLEEGWRSFSGSLSVGVLSSRLLAKFGTKPCSEHVFRLGSSGNVSKYKNKVARHQSRVLDRHCLGIWAERLGQYHLDLGNRPRARLFFEESLRLNPARERSAIKLANICFLDGKYDKAKKILAEFIKNNEHSAQALDRLYEMVSNRRDLKWFGNFLKECEKHIHLS